ncbi:CoA ester lyase [Pseudorhodoferax sp. Leaf274]|uniref:HpcH/HpaI aldolase/citrate lyase family protein n=1 Tax=Pseudorhodoferax sp. Leaf274 TaxID=1736318 RepID=UPI00070359D2|nr:CoA ester lyase [Pseudorhodoferax sp. Leaf274]KQP36386.1 citryl-CoA lyase [Pseudorhodoferax sp. Leaf274]
MRSKLFVPASRPELFAKAMASQTDVVSFDLEDAVEPASKDRARAALAAFLADTPRWQGRGKGIVVRVNAVDTPDFETDIGVVVRAGVDVVNLPMLDGPDAVRHAVAAIARHEAERGLERPISILANIESPRGVRRAVEIAAAHPRVIGLQIGYGDLLAPLGIVQGEPAAVQAVRFAVRLAAGEAGVAAYDGAYVDVANPDGYLADAQAARRLGFAGKSCIHPSQIALANQAFRPTAADIAHAVKVVEATRASLSNGMGAFLVDGKLVDGPFIAHATQTVAAAERLGLLPV